MTEVQTEITSLCFLNVIWFNHLKDVLVSHEVLSPTLDGFIENAITENKKVFNKYKEAPHV